MALRTSMSSLIRLVRTMIGDPSGEKQQYSDEDIQERLDLNREDIRYEPLIIAPSIVNSISTQKSPSTIFADYYSKYQWWEDDVVIQGTNIITKDVWAQLTPLASENFVGHWQFELDVFNTGTVPGQYPPVFATGKIHDPNAAAADLLEFWSLSFAGAYDITVDGQTLKRSQLMMAKIQMAKHYRGKSKPRTAKMLRTDVAAPVSSKQLRLLDTNDTVR